MFMDVSCSVVDTSTSQPKPRAGSIPLARQARCFWRFDPVEAVQSYVRPHMMMWTASPQRHHSAKAWSPERHKEGDRP